jgi:predicted  nucleic acid-binding Zn-ribbon protein
MGDHQQKRIRSEFNMRPHGQQSMQDNQQQQQQQPSAPNNNFAALATLRSEFQSVVENKDAEMKALRERNFQLESELNRTEGSRKANEDENKLLKRAVAIQDSRQRELISQNQQLQQVLAQAAEHIANIERVNRQLRSQLELINSPFTSFDDHNNRPPDVY